MLNLVHLARHPYHKIVVGYLVLNFFKNGQNHVICNYDFEISFLIIHLYYVV